MKITITKSKCCNITLLRIITISYELFDRYSHIDLISGTLNCYQSKKKRRLSQVVDNFSFRRKYFHFSFTSCSQITLITDINHIWIEWYLMV